MKRKTVATFLMGLCLTVAVPGVSYGADLQPETDAQVAVQAADEDRSEEEKEEKQLEEKKQASADAAGQEEPEQAAGRSDQKETESKKQPESEVQTENNTQSENKVQAERKAQTQTDAQPESKTKSEVSTQSDSKEKSDSSIKVQAGETGETKVQTIEKAVQAASAEKTIDLSSDEMKAFLEASDLYDGLSENEKKEIGADTVKQLETVRDRIGEAIHTDGQVTVSGLPWYVRVQLKDSTQTDTVCRLAEEAYPGSTPQAVYAKDIVLTDIRTDKTFSPEDLYDLTFPVPDGYDALTSPKVFRLSKGKLTGLTPKRENGMFSVYMVYPLENIFIVDTPAEMTGITMEESASINAGQSLTLTVSPVPAAAVQQFSLEWASSDPSVASVDATGKVTAYKEGTTQITATVPGTQWTAVCTVKVVQGAHALSKSVADTIRETRSYMLKTDKNPTVGSEWFVLGLARSGLSLQDSYFSTYYNHKANYLTEHKGKLTNTVKYTEYSKSILTLTAMGKDARNIAGYNLFEPLADFETVKAQGTNGPIWALLALNCNPAYTIPEVSGVKVQTTEEKLVDYLLSKETSKGGWTMAGDSPDSDLTGMALQALAPYYHVKGYEKVTAAIDRALEVLSTMQNQSGGYSTMGVETSESAAQVLTALCALGIDPMQDERFVKGGSWIVENLLGYRIEGSGFMHVKAGAENNGGGAAGAVNGMATEQAFYALTAYQRLLDGKTALYDMSDIQLVKGEEGDGKGTGLEEQEKDDKDSGKDTGDKDGSHKGTGDKNSQTDDKKDTAEEDTKKTVSKKKLTYKGKKLTLTGSKASGTGKTNDTDNGSTADGTDENTASGWIFDPEEYTEGEGGSISLLTEPAAVADGETAKTAGDTAKAADAAPEDSSVKTGSAVYHAVLPFLGGILLGAAAAAGAILVYRKKKGVPGDRNGINPED